MRTDEKLVRVNVTRFNVTVGGARFSLLRDVIERSDPRVKARWAEAVA